MRAEFSELLVEGTNSFSSALATGRRTSRFYWFFCPCTSRRFYVWSPIPYWRRGGDLFITLSQNLWEVRVLKKKKREKKIKESSISLFTTTVCEGASREHIKSA
ncbi:hypothetical protein, unlikely [Trypanosoma brucei gambiense DAL972]|uniref:Uncharacterized protein n=1 Tax=Trypanosoma brucei gambiense (strain MHOM/CI/86/DAL972) TaxID=679716 RepID=D0A1B2_TRYB9|nr:hypothetical protein, unlikely [Trypanosoma brucei gambiense DAL972]CBH15054.1 hypothetical protein, unlikely [Trypanosoma brucei gambiense DAL972]|eukprot:XP_011777320.1 hypothetical protein, unlikely [Trypanosoma brucei gambiense DAL972]